MRYLGGHDQLVVGDVVWCVAHPKQRAGGVEVARHAGPHVDILSDTLTKTANRWLNTHRLANWLKLV